MMTDDAVHSDVIRQQSCDINFLCLTNVTMKLSLTVLMDCLRGSGSYICLQNPETFDDILHIWQFVTFPQVLVRSVMYLF